VILLHGFASGFEGLLIVFPLPGVNTPSPKTEKIGQTTPARHHFIRFWEQIRSRPKHEAFAECYKASAHAMPNTRER
jgi:hypothetical protein